MLPLPFDIDIDSLRELPVTEVRYTTDAITVFFSDRAHIIINGYFALRHGRQRHEYFSIHPVDGDFGLLKLLGTEVADVYLNAGRDSLSLAFSNGSRLDLRGHKVEDEYTICVGDREAVV